jgi:hypothetical protein
MFVINRGNVVNYRVPHGLLFPIEVVLHLEHRKVSIQHFYLVHRMLEGFGKLYSPREKSFLDNGAVNVGLYFCHSPKFDEAVLNGISRKGLEAGFEEWLPRLDRCIQQNGEYVEKGEFNKHIFIISALSCLAMLHFFGTLCGSIAFF